MKRLQMPFLRQKKAISTAISAIIITAVTVSLVMIVAFYAYQVLGQQRGAAEFDVVKKSILAFDDALQDVAWRPNSSRMVRFKVEFGDLKLIPNTVSLSVSAKIDNSSEVPLRSVTTGLIKYSLATRYVTFGENYTSYILGDNSSIVTDSTESLSKVLIEQGPGLVDVTLSYRARAIRTSVIKVNGTDVNYVTIWLIKVAPYPEEYPTTHIHNFDLRAKCIDVETTTFGPYDAAGADYCTITVVSQGESSSAQIGLDSGKVVFSVVVAEVKVSV